jgi:DNA-binding NtrC family response regulator
MPERLHPEHPVILIDDEREVLESQAFMLRMAGISNLITCWDSRQAGALFQRHPTALVVLDLMMPGIDGRELLDLVSQNYPEIAVVIITGINDVQTAVECVRKGALDYIPKPVDRDRLVTSIRNALDYQSAVTEAQRLGRSLLSSQLEKPEAFKDFITQDRTMLDIFRYLEALAPTSLPVLLTGETGVGKEILARAIHRASGRRGHFVAVDTAGVDQALFSDTLFGHRTGAYTGAHRDRPGLIQRASNGTLFLDEIGDLSRESQMKLLRLLQEGTYYPLGSEMEQRSSARIIAATNRSL